MFKGKRLCDIQVSKNIGTVESEPDALRICIVFIVQIFSKLDL